MSVGQSKKCVPMARAAHSGPTGVTSPRVPLGNRYAAVSEDESDNTQVPGNTPPPPQIQTNIGRQRKATGRWAKPRFNAWGRGEGSCMHGGCASESLDDIFEECEETTRKGKPAKPHFGGERSLVEGVVPTAWGKASRTQGNHKHEAWGFQGSDNENDDSEECRVVSAREDGIVRRFELPATALDMPAPTLIASDAGAPE